MNWLSRLWSWFKFVQRARAVAVERNLRRAEQGDPAAAYSLGERYHDGLGLPRDLNQAFAWFLRAAQRGHARAQANVGMMLFLGRGTSPDRIEACKWLELSAQAGDPKGQSARQRLLLRLSSAEVAAGQERARAWRPVRDCVQGSGVAGDA